MICVHKCSGAFVVSHWSSGRDGRRGSSIGLRLISPAGASRGCRGQRTAELLHASARRQVTEVDREEAGGFEQLDDRCLGGDVVAGDEEHSAAARFAGVCAEHLGAENPAAHMVAVPEEGRYGWISRARSGGAMAIIEVPPSERERDEPFVSRRPPIEKPRSARTRGSLARRLPYALAVVALAAGYGLAHGINTPAPRASAPIVTADQINQALATTNGTPVVDDRGFSQLENGVQHNHGFELPMSAADRKELARELTIARETAMEYPTLADAERAHLGRAGPFSPGLGTHMLAYQNYPYAAGVGRMTDEQIRHPLMWIYDGTKPDSPVAGLFYSALVPNPEGFIGPNDVWHQHTNICIRQSPGGGIDAPLGADHDATVAQCDAVGGKLIKATGPLLHVWVVPGYEDSQGVFAHLNPAITCKDGTYHTIDITKVGTRASVCVDGSE
jgi:hypothetical protein